MKNKMSRGKLIFLVVFFGFAAFLFIYQRVHWPQAVVELKGQELNVVVAQSLYHQTKGLGGREQLAPYDGMIFPFSLIGKPAIVMRDMEFPIDIIWFLDAKVVDFAPNVAIEPGKEEYEYIRYLPRTEANMVLELPAGWADKHDLKIGDELTVIEGS